MILASYAGAVAFLWVVLDADDRGYSCRLFGCRWFENDFFVATVPFAIALALWAVLDARRPSPSALRRSAVTLLLAAIALVLFAVGAIEHGLDALLHRDHILIIK